MLNASLYVIEGVRGFDKATLVHANDELEIDDIWDTATIDVPDLIPKLRIKLTDMSEQR